MEKTYFFISLSVKQPTLPACSDPACKRTPLHVIFQATPQEELLLRLPDALLDRRLVLQPSGAVGKLEPACTANQVMNNSETLRLKYFHFSAAWCLCLGAEGPWGFFFYSCYFSSPCVSQVTGLAARLRVAAAAATRII